MLPKNDENTDQLSLAQVLKCVINREYGLMTCVRLSSRFLKALILGDSYSEI